jgi:glycerol uptake facilitator-like aquaporin
MMNRTRSLGNLVLINGAILVGVAIPHLIDDFLFGIPEEFNLSNIQAQILAGFFAAMLIVVFSQAARGQRWGYLGTAFLGGFLALSGILKHGPRILQPGPYWNGLFSEILIGIIILSGISLLIISLCALRNVNQLSPDE